MAFVTWTLQHRGMGHRKVGTLYSRVTYESTLGKQVRF
jgi:hypothetical protein